MDMESGLRIRTPELPKYGDPCPKKYIYDKILMKIRYVFPDIIEPNCGMGYKISRNVEESFKQFSDDFGKFNQFFRVQEYNI